MNNFTWQHITFENGSNPYICMTEKEFKRIKRKYNLEKIENNFWFAKEKNPVIIPDLFDFSDFE